MKYLFALVGLAAFVQAQPQAFDLVASHRSGQTFLTWQEAGPSSVPDSYRVYRHTEAIDAGNLSSAVLVGGVSHNSGFYRREAEYRETPVRPDFAQRRYIIQDLGAQLDSGVGLFVSTVHAGGDFYYAVTYVNNGVENRTVFASNALQTPVHEAVADPQPVQVWRTPDTNGRIYTQFMDYSDWNSAFEGYAYNYVVRVPNGYQGEQLPLVVAMHGHGSGVNGYGFYLGADDTTNSSPYGWSCILMIPDDIYCSWFSGFSQTASPMGPPEWMVPQSGSIRNYTEERIVRSIFDLVRNPYYGVDTNRVYAYGHSMGGTGALGLGLHYGNVFAAVFCSAPMTDWQTSGDSGGVNWMPDVESKWGSRAGNFTVENAGRWSEPLQAYNGTSVWDWTNRHAMVESLAGLELPLFAFYHGSQDEVVDYRTQMRPFIARLNNARVPFSVHLARGDHAWSDFYLPPNWQWDQFSFRRDEPIPAIGYATGSGPIPPPPDTGTEWGPVDYNMNISWSASWNDFDGPPIDTRSMFRITMRSESAGFTQHASVTPRRLRQFQVLPGDTIDWSNVDVASEDTVQRGTVVADNRRLATVENMEIGNGGNRLLFRLRHSGVQEEHRSYGPSPTLDVVPNPVRSVARIRLAGGSDRQEVPTTVSITDITGRRVANLDPGDCKWCPSPGLANGVYFISAVVDGRTIRRSAILMR